MNAQRGFTLIELAIVFVILMVLAGGVLLSLTTQIETRRIANTQKSLAEAREAIVGYALSHQISSSCTCEYNPDTTLDTTTLDGDPASTCPISLCPATGASSLALSVNRNYLPCPDLSTSDPEPNWDNDGVDGLNDLNNGAEDRYVTGVNTNSCATSTGNLPWATLGTASQDAWGNRLLYALTTSYGHSSTGFPGTNAGNLQICSTTGCTIGTVAANVPAVLVSFGPNGWGGRNINGSLLASPTGPDELENTDADANYVQRAPTKPGSTSGEFDDLVEWISHDLLAGRICPAGGCP